MQHARTFSPERLAAAVLLSGIVAAFMWAIAARAGVAGMWLDELSHRCGFAGKPLSELLRYPVSLSYILTKVCDAIYWSDFSSRLPVVLGSLLIVLGTYWTVAQCGSRYAGIAAAWVMLWHPYVTSVALQNRFYSLGAGLMLCSWVLAVKAAREGRRGLVLAYSAVAFLTAHAWPWGAPWVAGVTALLAYLLVRAELQRAPAEHNWWRVANNLMIAGLPVFLFAVHYLAIGGEVQSVSKTANDGFWREPQVFSPAYVVEFVRAIIQPIADVSSDYLLALLMASLALVLWLQPLPMGAFALLTYAVWGAAVHICNQAQVVPIPRRIVFTQVNTVVLWCAGWSALAGRVAAWPGWERLRRHRGAYPAAHAAGTCIMFALMLYYGWDRMILTRGIQALNHGPSHRAWSAVIRRHARPGARVIAIEDGNGISWGITAYALRPHPRPALEHDVRYVQFSCLPDAAELTQLASVHSQIWLVAGGGRLPYATRVELERSGLCLPFEYELWWYEPDMAGWDVSQRTAHIRAVVSQLMLDVPPHDITADEMTNLLARCSDADVQRHLRLLLVRRIEDKDDAYAFAQLLSSYGMHATAVKAARSPLYFRSRHTSIYEWIAGRLLELAQRVPEDARTIYEEQACACLRAAVRRGSPTAAPALRHLRMQHGATAVRLHAPSAPVLRGARGLLFHFYHDGTTPFAPFTTNLPVLNHAASFTVIAILQPAKEHAIHIPLGQGYGNSPSNSPWFLVLAPAQNHAGFAVQFAGQGETRAGYPWQPAWSNTWLCLAGVYDAPRQRLHLYVNGTCLASLEAPAGAPRITLPLPLGVGALSNGAFPLSGSLREAAIYGRALSERDVQRMLRTLVHNNQPARTP